MSGPQAAARDLRGAAGWAALLVGALGFILLTLFHLYLARTPGEILLAELLATTWILLAAYFTRALAHSLTHI